jgi:hypothetical protein
MPRVALPDSLHLCRISRCLYSPFVRRSTYFSIASLWTILTTTKDLFMRRVFQDLIGYPRILGIVDLRPLWGWHAYKASLRSVLLDSLQPCWEIWGSLHFVRSRQWLCFSAFLSIKLAMLPASMLGDYSTRASLTPSWFLRRTDLLGNLFFIMSLLDLLFSLSFLNHHTGHPVWVRPWHSLNFFIVVSIYWKHTSYRSSLNLSSLCKTTNRSC